MNSFITSNVNCGLGSTYDTLYRIYVTQEQLKKYGYNVKTYINFGLNPYKMDNDDRSVFFNLLKFKLIDNLIIYTDGINPCTDGFPEKNGCELYYNNSNIYNVYLNETPKFDLKLENFDDWYTRDDLPKISLLEDVIVDFCEEKLKNYPKKFYSIHYRPYEYSNQEEEISNNYEIIKKFIEENLNTPIFFFSQFKGIIDKLKKEKYTNLIFNDFDFKIDHNGVRGLGLSDDDLYDYMKEVIFDMYTLSKSEKILRIGGWFSNFLFFSSTYNQTTLSNKNRYCS
jgi:hypothetical protein